MKNKKNVPDIRFKGFAEKWTTATLSELSEPLEYGLNAAAIPYDGTNKYIRITDIDDSTHLFNYTGLTSPNANLSLSTRYQLRNGDILLARTGASVGKSYHYKDTDGLVYFAGFLIRAHIKSNVNSEFVFQNTLTNEYDKFVKITSQRSGQPGINAQEYSFWTLRMPKQFDEQQAIGNYFQNIDRLINTSQTKLDKLKNIKKACLEKMFPRNGSTTPELRFKGFSEEWEEIMLGTLMDVTSVKRIHQSDWTDNGIRFLRARDIVSSFKNERIKDLLYISEERYAEYSIISGKVQKGDLLVTGVGTIGVPMLIVDDNPLYFKDGNIIWFKNNNILDGDFLFYSFTNSRIQNYINESAGTGTVGTYTIESGKKTQLLRPKDKEQEKTGLFFRNLDELIAKTEQQINKLKNIKKACLDKMFVNAEG